MRDHVNQETPQLSNSSRILILVAGFLGWMFAGVQMGITTLAMRPAARDLLGTDDVDAWVGAYVCAFLLGAAAGGLVFGWMGDRVGRKKAMALAIVTYSLLSGLTYWVEGPTQLLFLRFVTCMGVGGMWPNGVALISEAWSKLSRPVVAGIIGTAANVGILAFAGVAGEFKIDADAWRWVMLLGAAPVVLGILVFALVPESPRWLATRGKTIEEETRAPRAPVAEIFRGPFLTITLVGIALGTIPLMGGWGSANWVMQWADQVGKDAVPPNPFLKADLAVARSITGVVGSLLGGLIASFLGRRRTYFLTSLGALATSQALFWWFNPGDVEFLILFSALGFFSGIYFGWLPLCLPELFPTRIRSTGAGVSFNWGRLLTAVAVLLSGALVGWLGGHAQLGKVTSLIFAVGMVAICFSPDTTRSRLED